MPKLCLWVVWLGSRRSSAFIALSMLMLLVLNHCFLGTEWYEHWQRVGTEDSSLQSAKLVSESFWKKCRSTVRPTGFFGVCVCVCLWFFFFKEKPPTQHLNQPPFCLLGHLGLVKNYNIPRRHHSPHNKSSVAFSLSFSTWTLCWNSCPSLLS